MYGQAWGWQKVASEALVVGALNDDLRGFFDLPPVNIFTTFRVALPAFASGSVIVKLRFGFTDADAAVAPEGVDATILNTLNDSFFFSVDWGGPAPAPQGTPNSILPPRVAVLITTVDPTDLTYDLFGACLLVP